MPRWAKGEAVIERLIISGELQAVRGPPGDITEIDEATAALDNAEQIISAAQKLLSHLSLF